VEVEMTVPPVVKRSLDLALKLTAALAFLPPLLTRITVGYAFTLTGWGKLHHLDDFVGFLTDLGVPFPALNAPFVAGVEFVGGVLLVIGLLTRLSALALAGSMAVALVSGNEFSRFLASWNPATEWGPLDISPWVFLVFLSWLVIQGPGRLSLDALLAKWLGIGSGAKAGGAANP
jgi:putative oxidoreductase